MSQALRQSALSAASPPAASPTLRMTDAEAGATEEQVTKGEPAHPQIFFAGGGTGGHIFPSLAILERLEEQNLPMLPRFLVSERPLDQQILTAEELPFTRLAAQPLRGSPLSWPGLVMSWKRSVGQIRPLMEQGPVAAVVAMGGFVSGPAIWAARRAGVPIIMVNLDAVPGRANRFLAGLASQVFTAYPCDQLKSRTGEAAQLTGLPLRRSVLGPDDQAQARRALGLDPHRPTLLVTGASQGASSLNQMMMQLATLTESRKVLATWQVIHLTGEKEALDVGKAYSAGKINVRIMPFCDQMGLAWRSASLAISRAGAGSVAEAWANRVPTIFMPYPYHKDQHQKHNAMPLVKAGAAILFDDRIDPKANAKLLCPPLIMLMKNEPRRAKMVDWLKRNTPEDGASVIASYLRGLLGK